MTETEFEIEYLGSTSGTYVHGRLLFAPQRLAYGQHFQLGGVSVEVIAPASKAPPPIETKKKKGKTKQ